MDSDCHTLYGLGEELEIFDSENPCIFRLVAYNERRKMKRTLEQLNLLDDFLFGSVMSYPEIGEAFCRRILKVLLKVDVGKLHVVPQKVYYGADTDMHGTRLDVYIEEDGGTGTIYDVEPDKNGSSKLRKALPRRVRFYHSKIDGRNLKAGDDYSSLKQVIVLMIVPYDPFGKDRIVYTIRNQCREEPEMEYDDGAATFFFYTRGTKGEVSEDVRKLLCYMEESSIQNADSEWLREIHRMVEVVRHDEEVSLEYMKVCEREKMIREQGENLGNVKIICNMRGMMNAEQVVAVTGLDQVYVKKIFDLLERYPEESGEEIASRLIPGESSVNSLIDIAEE